MKNNLSKFRSILSNYNFSQVAQYKRKLISRIMILALVVFSITFTTDVNDNSKRTSPIDIDNDDVPFSSIPTNIQEQDEDINVIPDKYNTGANISVKLTPISANMSYNGVYFKSASNNTKTALDLTYQNKTLSGTIIVENADFSNSSFCLTNENGLNRDVSVTFKNCVFGSITTTRNNSKLPCTFENCNIRYFAGSNCTFNNCSFGHSVSDGIVPFKNISLNNCYFSDMSHETTTSNHTDATQIFAYSDVEATNIHFSNCRFETPQLYPNSSSYVNACIMLQLEFNNGSDISFDNCILNGGGFSIYARVKNTAYTLSNVTFNNIIIGNSRRYGTIYPNPDENVTFTNVNNTSSLYVSSIWKDSNGTHLSVTNDSSVDRILKVYSDCGTFEYTIPAMPSYDTAVSNGYSFSDLPIDLDIVINSDCKYIACYDETDSSDIKQIRFIKWDESTINNEVSDINSSIEKNTSDIVSPVTTNSPETSKNDTSITDKETNISATTKPVNDNTSTVETTLEPIISSDSQTTIDSSTSDNISDDSDNSVTPNDVTDQETITPDTNTTINDNTSNTTSKTINSEINLNIGDQQTNTSSEPESAEIPLNDSDRKMDVSLPDKQEDEISSNDSINEPVSVPKPTSINTLKRFVNIIKLLFRK